MAYTGAYVTGKRYTTIRQRISKMRRRAQRVGLLYLLGTFLVTAFAVLSFMQVQLPEGERSLGVLGLLSDLERIKTLTVTQQWLTAFGLYGVALLVLAIACIKMLVKLKWLFKRKASRVYGVNRNAYAMEDMGKTFSRSFALTIELHILIYLIFEAKLNLFAWGALGSGLFVHFLCGAIGGNVSLFSMQNGELTEEKRAVGNVASFVRNIIQLILCVAVVYVLIKTEIIYRAIMIFFSVGDANIEKAAVGVLWQELAVTAWAAIIPLLCLLVLGIVCGWISYALSPREFDIDGAKASGRKRFLMYSVLLTVVVAGIFLVWQLLQPEALIDQAFTGDLLLVGALALVGVVAELSLFRLPKEKEDDIDDKEAYFYVETSYSQYAQPRQDAQNDMQPEPFDAWDGQNIEE